MSQLDPAKSKDKTVTLFTIEVDKPDPVLGEIIDEINRIKSLNLQTAMIAALSALRQIK